MASFGKKGAEWKQTLATVDQFRSFNKDGVIQRDPDSKGTAVLRDINNGELNMEGPQLRDVNVREKAISAAGAAFLSAVIVNPLDVAKTRLQAQAAGVDYNTVTWQQLPRHVESVGFEKHSPRDDLNIPARATILVLSDYRCPPVCPRIGNAGVAPLCPPACFQYKSTFDVFNKVIRQEGFFRLWRGTNAALAIAIPTVGIYLPCYDIFREKLETYAAENAPKLKPYAPFVAGSVARSIACIVCAPLELARTRMQARREIRGGVKPPGVLTILKGVTSTMSSASGPLQGIRLLWTGVGAQLARDVPFSAICWTTLEPTRRYFLRLAGPDPSATAVMVGNLSAGILAGSIAAAATCPLDVAKTRRQIEQDPAKALTTRQTLQTVWRDAGVKGLFTGVGPRVARAGPSVAIVVSFYEVVKYFLGTTS